MKTVEQLLSQGASLDVCSSWLNQTPLHYAAYHNRTEVALMLLTHNADIEARDDDSRTPLHYATWFNSKGVAQLLL